MGSSGFKGFSIPFQAADYHRSLKRCDNEGRQYFGVYSRANFASLPHHIYTRYFSTNSGRSSLPMPGVCGAKIFPSTSLSAS